jgi:hypothetical protein
LSSNCEESFLAFACLFRIVKFSVSARITFRALSASRSSAFFACDIALSTVRDISYFIEFRLALALNTIKFSMSDGRIAVSALILVVFACAAFIVADLTILYILIYFKESILASACLIVAVKYSVV